MGKLKDNMEQEEIRRIERSELQKEEDHYYENVIRPENDKAEHREWEKRQANSD